jgi:exodeoxyribonuclease V alpha subunit
MCPASSHNPRPAPKTAKNEAAPRETLAGSVERVTFHNADSGFAVLKVTARGQRDLVTVVGHAPTISAGEFIHATGLWITDRTHGLQFKAEFLKTTPPTTAEGIERFLASGMARGIGAVFAKRIVAAFGEHTFEIIEQNPEKLREVDGIGLQRAQRIAAGWTEQKAVRDIMVFLHSHGVGASRAVRIYKTYGQDAIQVMTGDPYRLAHDIRGIGFRTADAIAMRLGLTKEAPARVRAGLSFALQEATSEGHCGLPIAAGATGGSFDVDETLVRGARCPSCRTRKSLATPSAASLACSCAASISPNAASPNVWRASRAAICPGRPSTPPRPYHGSNRPPAKRWRPRSAPPSIWRCARRWR